MNLVITISLEKDARYQPADISTMVAEIARQIASSLVIKTPPEDFAIDSPRPYYADMAWCIRANLEDGFQKRAPHRYTLTIKSPDS